jgi:mevalonate kinase
MQASAPAKIILFGEHAVVYAQPAIAVPVSSLRATVTVQPNPAGASGLRIVASDLNQTLPYDLVSTSIDNALMLTVKLVLESLGSAPPDVLLTVRSSIPVASGLGSGAAVSTALARAIAGALGRVLDRETLNSIVYEVEKVHHGTPSGIDNTVIVYEQPIYFMRGEPIETIAIDVPLHFVIADTGQGALTRVAVGAVRELYEANPDRIGDLIRSIGVISTQARRAIERGALAELGALMRQNHAHLQTLTVSSPELDALVNAALEAGALGAKLSGGGRGGNMIALVTPETQARVEAALWSAGAARVITTVVQ